jgi:hypothetical protein
MWVKDDVSGQGQPTALVMGITLGNMTRHPWTVADTGVVAVLISFSQLPHCLASRARSSQA